MATATHFDPLPTYLADIQRQMEDTMRNYGLDFYPTIFEVVDCDQLNEIAAYGGFPTRYPHWRFGMEYEELSKGYEYGLQKIYELVINNDPCYAYLMRSNAVTDQKLVMAHVYGHCDFFKNNNWFSQTNRKMMDEMANHGNRVRRYMDRFGVEEVELLHRCLPQHRRSDRRAFAVHQTRRRPGRSTISNAPTTKSWLPCRAGLPRRVIWNRSSIRPTCLAAEAEQLRKDRELEEKQPSGPARDVMKFIRDHAPLKPWQVDVLSIIREEAYYFAPQGQTKIMNEGWASYWHSTIMTRQGLEPGDVINYADHHSGTMASSPTRLNPYKLGIELLRDIEDRWNRGRFGKELGRVRRHARPAANGTPTPAWAAKRSSKFAAFTTT